MQAFLDVSAPSQIKSSAWRAAVAQIGNHGAHLPKSDARAVDDYRHGGEFTTGHTRHDLKLRRG